MIYMFDLENVSGKAFIGIENLGENDKVVVFYSQNSKNISIDTHLKIVETPVKKDYIKVKIGGRNALDFQLSSYIGYLFGQNANEEITIVSGDMGFDYVVDFWKDRNCVIKRRLFIDAVEKNENIEQNKHVIEEFEVENEDLSENLSFFDEKEPENDIEQQESENASLNKYKFGKFKLNINVVPEETQNEASIQEDVDNSKDFQKVQEITKNSDKTNIKSEINVILCKKIGTTSTGEVHQMIEKYKTKQGINNALCKKLGSQTAGEVYKIIKPLIENKKGR